MDRAAAEDWIRAHVEPVGAIETNHERPWATVLRVPLADAVAWFKACAPVQAFEPRLTAGLFARWPDRVAEMLAHDEERAWLLLADGGRPIRELGNPPEAWLAALPLCAELQRGEAAHVPAHLANGVPDLRVATLPRRYEELLRRDLPIGVDEIASLRTSAPHFAELCGELAAHDIAETVQHDDLHMANVYAHGGGYVCSTGATPRSRTHSHRLSSRSGSSRRSTGCHRPTRGSRACATGIWSRGVAISRRPSHWRSASPRSPVRSPGRASETTCQERHTPTSTGGRGRVAARTRSNGRIRGVG